MSFTAIIPAAGVGTRLRPHTYSRPKALLPVAGRPVLGHILDPLVEAGVDRVILVLGYMAGPIADWVRRRYRQLPVEEVVQAERLGLGHAVHRALEGANLRDEPGLIVLGDTIVRTDFKAFLAHGDNPMGVKAVADPRRFGVAVVESDRIVALEEKPAEPRSNLALVGLYAFARLGRLREALARLIAEDRRTRGEYQLTDALQALIQEGEHLMPYTIEDWFDVGKAETWLETNRILLDGLPAPAPRPGLRVHPPVHLPDSAEVTNSELGPNVSVGEDAVIRGSRVHDSIVGDGAWIEDCRLQESLIGARCKIGGLAGRLNLGDECEAWAEDYSSTSQR